ncbi:hypothetical protein ACWD1Y_31790 [Streptomyces sp. NPDC002814]
MGTHLARWPVPDGLVLKALVRGIPAVRSRRIPRRRRPVELHADKAYFSAERLAWLRDRGLVPRIARRASKNCRHPDCHRILAVFHEVAGPLRARNVCRALGHEPLPGHVAGTRAKLKRLVRLGLLAEADTGGFARRR